MKSYKLTGGIFFVLLLLKSFYSSAQNNGYADHFKADISGDVADRIVGRWMSKEKNLMVDVYKADNIYKAKIIWFSDSDDPSHPMATRTDSKNTDIDLQSRKILGMQVLRSLNYASSSNTWENGIIYDADSGREWSAYAYFTPEGTLKVKGYWKFKFICKSLEFNGVKTSKK
ncbi:uncharacterized protein (DUF2147 family) [Pedobacter sp. UYP24]